MAELKSPAQKSAKNEQRRPALRRLRPVMLLSGMALAFLIMGVGFVTPGISPEESLVLRELEAISQAFHEYRVDLGGWPQHACQSPSSSFSSTYLQSYATLFCNQDESPRWQGPYLALADGNAADQYAVASRPDGILDRPSDIDPWGKRYIVYTFHGGRSVSILSSGADGIVNSNLDRIIAGKPAGDDMIVILTQ